MPTTTTKKATSIAKAQPKVKAAAVPAIKVVGSDADGWQFQCECETTGWLMEERADAERLGQQHLTRQHGVKKGAAK